MSKSIYKSDKTRTLVTVAMFSALAYICCVVFHFKLLFLSFDLKDAVMAIGAMLLGPVYGLAMAVIVALIEFATISTTQTYGLIMNIISSVTFVFVGSFIYTKKRTLSGAVIGMIASVIAMPAVMMPANLLITPHYYGVSVKEVIDMIPTILLPFNITKAMVNASIVFLLYKPLSKIIKLSGFKLHSSSDSFEGIPETTTAENAYYGITVTVIAVLLGVLTLYYFFSVLGGKFSWK